MCVCLFLCMHVCMYVRLQLGNGLHDCDEIFRVAPGYSRDSFRHKDFVGLGYGARKVVFFVYFMAAPADEA